MPELLEARYSLASAVSGMVACSLACLLFAITLWGLAPAVGTLSWGTIAASSVGMLVFGSIVVYLGRRARDRSVKLRITDQGIEDYQPGAASTAWSDVANIPPNPRHSFPIVRLQLRSGTTLRVLLGGLDRKPPELEAELRRRFASYLAAKERSSLRPDGSIGPPAT
jgi:hypothetical protein